MIGTLLIVIIVAAIVIMYANKARDIVFSIYHIKEGKHYSYKDNSAIPVHIRNKFALASNPLKFEAMFAQGCDHLSIPQDDDINKLLGVSYGINNHKDSVRIGWRFNAMTRYFELFSYAYVNGNRIIEKLPMLIKQYESIYFCISHSKIDQEVLITMNRKGGKVMNHKVKGIKKPWISLMQYPYFGGNEPAPNFMKIIIKQY